MNEPIKVNGIVLSNAFINEVKTLQNDDGDMAKYHIRRLNEVIGVIANLNGGTKQRPPDKLLEYVTLLTDISQLLNSMAE